MGIESCGVVRGRKGVRELKEKRKERKRLELKRDTWKNIFVLQLHHVTGLTVQYEHMMLKGWIVKK